MGGGVGKPRRRSLDEEVDEFMSLGGSSSVKWKLMPSIDEAVGKLKL